MSYEMVMDIAEDNLGYDISIFEDFNSGVNFETYKVTLSDGRIVFMKGYTSTDNSGKYRRLKRERDVLYLLDGHSISFIPRLYDSWFGANCGVLVCEFVSGEPFSRDVMCNEEFAQSVGERLSELHSLSGEKIHSGEYGPTGIGIVEETRSVIEDSPYEEAYMSLLEGAAEVIVNTDSVSGMTHGDFHPPNLLFDSDTGLLANIIDWEYGGVSDVTIDIAKFEVRAVLLYEKVYDDLGVDSAEVISAFRRGYEYESVDFERLEALKIMFVLREIGLVYWYGELDTWERVADGLSVISECERVLENLLEQ